MHFLPPFLWGGATGVAIGTFALAMAPASDDTPAVAADGTIYVGGKVASLGIDCVPGEWTDADTELIERKFANYELGKPPGLRKFVCGKKLYNYDNLEPSERKLVL